MDLAAGHLQVVVPPRGPSLSALRPPHVIGKDNVAVHIYVEHRRRGVIGANGGDAGGIELVRAHRLHHAARLDFEPNNAVALVIVRRRMVLQDQIHMVVQEVLAVALNTDREASHVRLGLLRALPPVARCRRQIVHEPIHDVFVLDHALEFLPISIGERLLAKHLASAGVLQHPDLIGRILDHVPDQQLTQVLHAVLDLRRLAVRQCVVPIRQLRLRGHQLVDLQLHPPAFRVLDGRHTW
mmetsp:Transcript_3821/g.11091  ORF Transcript_3821/g.11091 Transcript_3821/m.11091 type:complete len:240 (+) Transcript_3821:1181-1900(+)